MAKNTEVVPASSVEMPPNKAIAAGGTAGFGSIVVGLGLYYFAPDTPPHITALWDALVAGIFTFGVTYLVPHGAVMKGDQ